MPAPSIYVESLVRGDADAVMPLLWQRTQDPADHARWDLRFTDITTLPTPQGEPQRFRYAVSVPGLRTLGVEGVGVSAGEVLRPDGTRTSALRFASDSRLSPIARGSGYWRYVPTADGVRFLTGYRYDAGGQGRLLDDLVVRRLVGAATAWSFDRLRLWLERDLSPEAAARRWLAVTAARSLAVAVVLLAGRSAGSGRACVRAVLSWVVAATVAVVAVTVPAPLDHPSARRPLRRAPDRLGQEAPTSLSGLRLWARDNG